MRPFGVIARLITCAAILCAVGSAGVAMDLSEMPPWLRALIQPVHLGPAAEVETVQVGAPGALAPAIVQPAIVGRASSPTPTPGTAEGIHIPDPGPVSVGGAYRSGLGAPGTGGPCPGHRRPDRPRPRQHLRRRRRSQGIGAGPATVGIGAPGAGPVSVGGGVSIEAWGTPGAGAVHAPGIGGATGPAPVSIPAAAQDWSQAVSSIEGLDRETAQAGQILAMIRERGMSAEQFAAWTAEHRPAPEVLSAAVAMVGFHRQDNYPTPQPEALAIASGLAVLAGDDLAEVETILPSAGMAGDPLSTRGDDQRAEKSFDSMADEELVALPRETVVMTVAHLIECTPSAAIPAIERYAVAGDREPEWCIDMAVACRKSGRIAVLAHLIPFAQRALRGAIDHGRRWDMALVALIAGFEFIGQHSGYGEHRLRWLLTADPERVPVAIRHPGQTADRRGPAGRRRPAGAEQALPPHLGSCLPGSIDVRVPQHAMLTRSVHLCGNATLRIASVRTTGQDWAASCRVVSDGPRWGEWRVEVTLGPFEQQGRYRTELVLETNSRSDPRTVVPILVSVDSPLVVTPPGIVIGPITHDRPSSAQVRLRGVRPFRIQLDEASTANAPFSVALTMDAEDAYTMDVMLNEDAQIGIAEGEISLLTDVEGAHRVSVPYRVTCCLHRVERTTITSSAGLDGVSVREWRVPKMRLAMCIGMLVSACALPAWVAAGPAVAKHRRVGDVTGAGGYALDRMGRPV